MITNLKPKCTTHPRTSATYFVGTDGRLYPAYALGRDGVPPVSTWLCDVCMSAWVTTAVRLGRNFSEDLMPNGVFL